MPKVIGTVFGLNDVYTLLKQNATTGTDDYWPVGIEYSIWAEGIRASATYTGSDVARLDNAVETLWFNGFAASNLPFGSSWRGGISDSKLRYGWFIGGVTGAPSFTSQIARLDMTGSVSTMPQNWPAAHMGVAGASNEGYGYGVGGGGDLASSLVNKFDYSSETISAVTNLPASRMLMIPFGNGDSGWFTGGLGGFSPIGASYSNTVKLDYSTDTFSASSNHPVSAIAQATGGGTNYYGFTFGGGNTTALSNTTKFDFNNETYAAESNMPQARRGAGANLNGFFGYLLGGSGPSFTPTTYSFTLYSNMIRYDTGLDLYELPGINGFARAGQGTAATGGVKRIPTAAFNGYLVGGYGATGYRSSVYRHDFDADTYTQLNPLGPPAAGGRTYASVAGSRMFVAGGYLPPNSATTAINQLDFNTESGINGLGAYLPTAASFVTGTENAASNYAYFCGGFGIAPGVYYTSVDRIDYSTTIIDVSTNLPTARAAQTPTTSSYLGKSFLFGGDQSGGSYSSAVMKLDWSNETWDTSVNMPSSFYNFRAFRNNKNAWLCPGAYIPQTSIMYRWDFSTDTRTSLTPLPAAKRVPTVTWSNYKGYIGGGVFNPTAVFEYDMSTETSSTATALPTNNSDTGAGTNTNTY